MSSVIQKSIILLLKLLTGLAAGYYIILFLYVSISRIAFPFAFDWVEGAVLMQVNHLLSGQSMYAEPNAAYTALIYPPLYFYVSAVMTRLLGFGFLPLRLTSLLATCGCMLMIFIATRKITASNLYGLASAGLFAATYASVWSWFDFARVDMLYTFLILAGLLCLNPGPEGKPVLAGVIFALSFFTKQSVLFLVFPLAVLTFFLHRRQAVIFILVFGVIAAAGFVMLNTISNGWYSYYVFTLPSNHILNTSPGYLYPFVKIMLGPIFLSFGIGMAAALIRAREYFQNKSYLFFFMATLIGLASSIVSGLSQGSTHNAYIPAYVIIAILFGIGLAHLEGSIALIKSANIRTILNGLLLAAVILQFWMLSYKTRDFVPGEQDLKRGNALLQYIADTPGDILIPSHSYLALYVKKKPYYHDAPLWELNGAVGKRVMPEWKPIKTEIKRYVQSRQVSFVFLEQPIHTWLGLSCAKEDVFKSNSKFVPTFYRMACY
jgi:4-amino-4-deoxy-L-arabinose transferase-like glycosyltransferase